MRHLSTYATLLLLAIFSQKIAAQNQYVDSMKNWIVSHPALDSQHILTLHRISFRLSEIDIRQSFQYYEKVSILSDSLNFVYGKSLAQINLAILFYNSSNFDASNTANYKAIDYAEACGAMRLKAIAFNNIGENFHILNDLDKCREYTKQAIVINKNLQNLRGVAINYELLQVCDLDENLFTNAENNLRLGMSFAKNSNDSYILSLYYLGFGNILSIKNKTDSALSYYSKAIQLANLQGDERNKFKIFMAQVQYLKHLEDSKKLALLDSAYEIAVRTNYLPGIAQSAELISAFYDNKKDKPSSFNYYAIYKKANDSIFSQNNRRNVIIRESDWMLKRKEIENKHLQELAHLQKKDLVFKNAFLLGSMILILLLVIIAFFIYKSIQSKKQRLEADFRQKIAEVKMESLRSQMNPHFIFNCLNSIENFMMRNEKLEAIEYLNKFSRLIRIILNSSRNEFFPFLKDLEGIKLYVELEQLRFNEKFLFTTNIDPNLINGDFKVPSLLIQPYIENAIIHGLAQSEAEDLHLNLSARLENNYIVYSIEDNGIGRIQSQLYKKNNRIAHKSLGLELSQERIDIYNLQQKAEGSINIIDLYDQNKSAAGTKVEIKIMAL